MRPARLLLVSFLTAHVIADGASIVEAIGTISNATLALNSTVASFPENPFLDLFALVPLLISTQTVLNDIDAGTSTASSSTNLTLAETISVATATGKLSTVVQSTLHTIVLAKPKFDKLLVVNSVVLLNLKKQQAATIEFGQKVVEKVPVPYRGLANLLLAPILAAFNGTIEIYEG